MVNFICGTHVNGGYKYQQVLKLGKRPNLVIRNSDKQLLGGGSELQSLISSLRV